jgi:hypothetical protein
MPEKFALADMQSQIILDSDLSNEEVRVVTIVRESMEDSNSFSLSGLLRLGVMMLGVGLMLYGVLLPIAYIFDRENRLFRFSMLGLLTAWRYKVDDGSVPLEMQKQDKKHKYMTVGRLVRKCVITEIVAFALVSGVVYKFVGMFILYIESIKGA